MAQLGINLIPPRVKKARTQQLIIMAAIGGAALILALPVGVLVLKYTVRNSLQERLNRVKAESNAYLGIIAKVAELQAQEETLAKKLEMVDKIVGNQATWIKLLEGVSACQQSVKDLWLTGMNSSILTGVDAGKMMITLTGAAFSKPAVADFAKVLRQNEMFAEVELISLAESVAGGQTTVAFVINVKFKK